MESDEWTPYKMAEGALLLEFNGDVWMEILEIMMINCNCVIMVVSCNSF